MNTLTYKGRATKGVNSMRAGVIYLHHFGTGWQELVFDNHADAQRFAEKSGAEFRGPKLPACDQCPHENYMTISVRRSEHQCGTCGATFIDPTREKRYIGRAAETR